MTGSAFLSPHLPATSWLKLDIYNPNGEKKQKDRSKRSCISCYNRSDRKCNPDDDSCEYCAARSIYCRGPIQTMTIFDTKLFDQTSLEYLRIPLDSSALDGSEMSAHCLLSIQWPSATTTAGQALPARQISVDLTNLNDYRNPVLDSPQLDSLLDDHRRDMDPPTRSDRSIEEDYVQRLQCCSRRLCVLLQAMSHAKENIVSYMSDHVAILQKLVCGILRQFCYKAVSLWETMFENLRSWVFGRRNKSSFLRQKGIIATSLAHVYSSIESYHHASQGWSGTAFTMVNLATDPRSLLRQLEFLGKGIEMRNFGAARQTTSTNVAVIHVSTVKAPTTNKLIGATFLDILAQGPYSTTPQSFGSSPAQHSFESPSLPKKVLPLKSSFDSPKASVLPTDPGSSKLVLDNGLDDLADEETLRQQAQAHILSLERSLEQERVSLEQMRVLLKTQEQKVRNLEEEIYMTQLSLGPAQAPSHMEVWNVFDEMLTTHDEHIDDFESPGAMTLVEPIPDAIFEPATEDKVFGTLDALFDDPQEVDDVSMGDAGDSPGIKKRKRFSTFAAAKKARTNDYAHPPTIHQSEDEIKHHRHPTTRRPTSWPRTRLFRRSAGVSVKKLTDVFEKLRLQHDRLCPAAV
ncbi:MAG: hypothetical protein Q9223_004586 [Gallowayella weberi]